MSGEHLCLHEEDFGSFKTQLLNIEKKQDKVLATIEGLFSRIEGKDGLTSEIAILKTQYRLAPSTKQLIFYSSIGGCMSAGVITVIAIAVKAWGWN